MIKNFLEQFGSYTRPYSGSRGGERGRGGQAGGVWTRRVQTPPAHLNIVLSLLHPPIFNPALRSGWPPWGNGEMLSRSAQLLRISYLQLVVDFSTLILYATKLFS